MIIDLVEYLGEVKNDTGVLGKAFIFNVILDDVGDSYVFDSMLFVHPTVDPFISVNIEDENYKDDVMKKIFETYTLEQLLDAK